MSTDEIPEFTDNTGRSESEPQAAKRMKTSSKPLFKMNIQDLISIPYDTETDSFKFRSNNVNLVMCGGKIKDIFQDDQIVFSFEVTDADGNSIRCFHKYKCNPEKWLESVGGEISDIRLLQSTTIQSIDETRCSDSTIFASKLDETVKKFEDDTKTAMNEILFWFKNELENKPITEIGDTVHALGYLFDDKVDECRKINVQDFRIVRDELEHEDLKAEIEFMYKHVYK